ncbi:sulfate ABC transporter substrate-binding protein [Actinokineospora fastidiosa]|uniref:Sulfate ABC transporter substrate-binding protein n=1 Tax=Actinokineospora fastidiosa TaxID=1816 RepID=A0A918GH82_9PSEU|nr:sulfate ABC transporter substrate-binding protein [Actinokineospora fastidiosa]GGS36533.1 sulfate ABC transporter substrate-binding protein [Actinokineospora fastidiosa]
MRKTAVAAVLVALSACGTATGDGADTTLSLVGFAVPKAANNAIQREWAKTPDGAGVTWQESYGASGDQSRAVAGGLPADYVHFSLEGDVTRLVDAGLVAPEWDKGPTKGIVSTSVVVIAVRAGNPKGITGWDDLVEPGLGIVTPNPGSSGSARWNILAAYGHAQAAGLDAEDFTTRFFRNVVALPGSGRDATTAFTGGTGDVLLTYENEAILARQNGAAFDYIVPDTTLLIENPGAVLKSADPKAVEWLRFVLGPTGQTEFARTGFRPVIDGISVEVPGANDPANPFPAPRTLQTIAADFGGWPAASERFFAAETGVITSIQRETGKS